MFYYALIILAGLLFALMIFATSEFQKFNGSSIKNGLVLIIASNIVICLFFLIKGSIANNEFHFSVTWFSILSTLLISFIASLSTLIAIQILKHGRMAYFSIFVMAGAIVLPSIVGMAFFKESITPLKIILIVIMVITCFFTGNTVKQKTKSIKSILLLFAAFLCNGLKNIIFTIYKYNPSLVPSFTNANNVLVIDNDVYMVTLALSMVLISFIVWIVLSIKEGIKKEEPVRLNKKYILISLIVIPLLYGLFSGIGDYFLTISTGANALNASVVFPINSGATILFSGLIGIFILKEPVSPKKIISLVIMIACTVCFLFVK